MKLYKNVALGILLCILTASISIKLSDYVGKNLFGLEKSPISPIIIAIIIGMVFSNLNNSFISKLKPGYDFCIKRLLKLGIIFLGIRLSFIDLVQYGSKALIVVIPCILITIVLVKSLSIKFKIPEKLSLLIAVGTSICGATAIAALAPSINAKKTEITYAIANITVFGLFAMFFYPIISNIIFLNDALSVGLFLGSSIPIVLLPGIIEILADSELVFLAISSDKLIILETFTPAAGSNSFKVTTGPWLTFLILPFTPKSKSIFSKKLGSFASFLSEFSLSFFEGFFNKSKPGNLNFM